MAFDGLRVLSLESRRAVEIERLIRNQGGEPFVAPSVREVPLEQNMAALAFAERLFAGGFDMAILLTGVGTRLLNQVIETRWPAGSFADALRKIAVVVRGPKPAAVMREWGVPIAITAPEPNTWREVLAATEGRPEKRIAVQEYGRASEELIRGLKERGAEVTQVPVYQWELPKDIEPLREASRKLALGEIDVVLFTAAIQVEHLFRVAEQIGLADAIRNGMARAVVASIGPTTSETLREMRLPIDFEPSHPKMGILINELARKAGELLREKRGKMKQNSVGPPKSGGSTSGGMKPDSKKFALRAARYTSMAMSLPAGVLAGYLIGYALDAWLHTTYLKVVFLILGIVSGFTQLIQSLRRDMQRDAKLPK
jgi:uroporphyrinogen-III synthase